MRYDEIISRILFYTRTHSFTMTQGENNACCFECSFMRRKTEKKEKKNKIEWTRHQPLEPMCIALIHNTLIWLNENGEYHKPHFIPTQKCIWQYFEIIKRERERETHGKEENKRIFFYSQFHSRALTSYSIKSKIRTGTYSKYKNEWEKKKKKINIKLKCVTIVSPSTGEGY